MIVPVSRNGDGQAIFRDPAFTDNKNLPVHRWVPWIAGYSAPFVDDAISAFLPHHKKALILDPFCGVGTTLLQATLRGHDAIGFEINPYPALSARAKLNTAAINLAELDVLLLAMQAASAKWRSAASPKDAAAPPLKSRIPFFSPAVEKQVLHALTFINHIEPDSVADLFRAAFGAVMVSFSNYSYEPSLGSRPAAGKPLVDDADVAHVLLAKLHQMRADIAWLQAETEGRSLGSGQVINSDFFATNGQVATGSVDLVITSPPYMNNYHYVRNTRPQLYWLNFISSPGEQKHLETNNFGQYWQTVRDADPIDLAFEHAKLQKTIKQLRETRSDRGAYGGPGWANYVTAYFNDCYRFIAALKRVLARNGVGVIVIGNSIIQGINIRTETILGEIGAMQGLTLEGVQCIREKRVGASITQSSVRQGERSDATLSESAVIVRKR
ncbi:MAG: site-specific DNA-methyltransferase [Chloroflexi bacterium]|nr:site-specific DNA-methyltransferase [Chloroflexota bacterium]